MRCVTVHTAVLALLGALFAAQQLATAQYLNNRPYPTYSLEQMPDTRFTCRDKVLGGYYADSETQCQMFHICVKVAGLGVQDFRFLCPNGTAFDQDSQICADWDDVDCEAATLYYSSDNFDLYRVGSGYETAAFAGEDEGTFHLQRSETGDARLIREHQSQRVNQQTDYNTVVPPRRPSPPQQRGERDRDILRASQSGNFFNNRNGGKEEDDYYNEDRHPNQNQDVPKKKVVRKFNQRKPVEDNYEQPQAQAQPQAQTQRPQRPTGFVNNFAGSIRPISTTLKPTTVNNNDQYQEPRRQNPRNRGGDRQYNNAENFRNNDYNRNQQASTPAPFRAPENNNKQYKNTNRQTTQYNNQYDNGQYNPTTAAPKSTFNNNQYDNQRTTQAVRQNFNNNNQQYQAKQQTENYPSTPAVNNKQTFQNKQTENYPSTPAVNNKQTFQNKQTENYPTTPVKQQNFNNYQTKQTENYPTTPIKQQTFNNNFQTKQTENYPSTPAVQNYNSYKQTDNYPSTVAKPKQTDNYPSTVTKPKQTDNYPSTVAKPKQTENYPSTVSPFKQQTTQFKKETENYPTTAGFTNNQNYNKQYDIPKKTTQFKQTENYPTTLAPSKQTYQKPTTQYYQPKETENYPQNNNKQSTQQYNTQYDNPRTQHSPTNRPTTQHTQYTPTVPKQTAQFYASTTPSARFSKQFDETSYDDGSYNGKYDEDKYKPEEEFLKTAHSQNFASARNELLSSTKTGSSVTTQSPRPFSLTTPIPRASSPARQTQSLPKQTQAIPKQTQAIPKQTQAIPKQTQAIQKQTQAVPKQSHRPEQQQQPKKKEKDVSYDYAYYDSNVGSEPDYDIGTEFAKSTKKTN